jgi:glutathione S-transferase
MNSLEQLVVFLPAIWLFAQVSATWAAGLGAVYLVGRMIYFYSYTREPKSRSLGFALTQLPVIVMVLGVLVAGVRHLLT